VASLSAAAASGNRRDALEALRALLAASLEDVEPDKRAPLAKQLRETMAEIDALPVNDERSQVGDLTARRAARLSASTAAG